MTVAKMILIRWVICGGIFAFAAFYCWGIIAPSFPI